MIVHSDASTAAARDETRVIGRLLAVLDRVLGADRRLAGVLRGSALVMGTQIVGIGLAYSMQVLVARWAGAFEFGVFAYAWTWMNIIFLVGSLGMNDTVLRLLPAHAAHAEWAKLRGLVVRGPVLVLLLSAAAALAAVLSLGLLGGRVGEHYRLPLLLTFAAIPLFGLLSYYQAIGRALNRPLAAFLPRYICLPLLVLLAAAGFVLAGRAPDAGELVWVTVGAALLLLAAQAVTLLRGLPPEARQVTAESPVRQWLRLSTPLFFITVCYGLLTHCDLLMVGFLLSAEDVAVYQAASRTAALISFPLLAMNALVAPMIARLYAEGDRAELQRSVAVATQVVFWPSLAAGLAAIAGGDVLLGVFGPAFPAGHTALAILVLGHLVSVGTGPVSYLMTMTGHQDRCALYWAITVAGQFAVSLLLIPRWGIAGAAVGTTLATCFLSLSLTIVVRRRLDVRAHALLPMQKGLFGGLRAGARGAGDQAIGRLHEE